MQPAAVWSKQRFLPSLNQSTYNLEVPTLGLYTTNMARIDIKETSQGATAVTTQAPRGENSKSPSPVRKAPLDKNKAGGVGSDALNSDSGYFEGPEEDDNTLQSESSVEIIFDKNASNNNVGSGGNKNSGRSWKSWHHDDENCIFITYWCIFKTNV